MNERRRQTTERSDVGPVAAPGGGYAEPEVSGSSPAGARGGRYEPLPSLAGTILERKYRVDRVIAEGGFSVVYAGHHLALDVPIAVKVLKAPSADRAARSGDLLMFLEEAKTIAKLRHPDIVQILDAGVTHPPGGSAPVPWMVFEWLDGVTLRDELRARSGRGLSPRACMELLRPVLDAIAEAHDAGIVHRDIKAGNIMLVPSGGALVAKVLDFGIAKIMGADEQRLSPSGHTGTGSADRAFTPASAAPEQLSGARTGPWTDVFALGLLLTEVLAGRPPFAVDDANEHYSAVFDAARRPTPAKLGVDVGAWEPVLARALAISPAARQPNARALARELEAALAGVPVDGPALDAGAAPKVRAAEGEAPDSAAGSKVRAAAREVGPEAAIEGATEGTAVVDAAAGAGPRAARERGARRAPWPLALVMAAALAVVVAAIALTRGAQSTAVAPLPPPPEASPPAVAAPPRLTERRLTSLEPNRRISEVALSHDKTRVAFLSEGAVWIQEVATGERVQIAKGEEVDSTSAVECGCEVDWLPGDREILVRTADRAIEAVDVVTRARRIVRKEAVSFRLAPDGRRMAIVVLASPGVRIEELDGSLDTILMPSISSQRISEIAWAPSGRWLSIVFQGQQVGRGGEELVVASADGAWSRVVARGTLMTSDGVTGVAWPSDDRLLFLRPALRGGGVTLMELGLGEGGEPLGEPVPLYRSSSGWSSLSARSDALAFITADSQDDVFVARLAASGVALGGPFERATNSDASDSMIGWTSSSRFVFVSNRGDGQALGVYEQEVGGAPKLLGPGPDIYTAGAVVLTEDGRALFWRGGPGASPAARPCELVRMTLDDGRQDVIAANVAEHPEDDAALTCRARIACAAGRCAVMGTGSVSWLDVERGARGPRFAPPPLSSAGPVSGVAVSRDGRIAVVTEREPSNESQIIVLRPDGAVESVAANLHLNLQVISFALDGRRIYATDFAEGAAGLVALDLGTGAIHRLVDRDRRWRANPRVSPDGKSLALTVRSRQANIGYLERDP